MIFVCHITDKCSYLIYDKLESTEGNNSMLHWIESGTSHLYYNTNITVIFIEFLYFIRILKTCIQKDTLLEYSISDYILYVTKKIHC